VMVCLALLILSLANVSKGDSFLFGPDLRFENRRPWEEKNAPRRADCTPRTPQDGDRGGLG